MKDKLNELMLKEIEALGKLLALLEEQNKLYVDGNIFGLEGVVKKIENANSEVAKIEIERRKFVEDKSLKSLLKEINDYNLNESFDSMVESIQKVKEQNSVNQFLIKQGLLFTNKMLNIFGKNKNVKTYNGYGKISR